MHLSPLLPSSFPKSSVLRQGENCAKSGVSFWDASLTYSRVERIFRTLEYGESQTSASSKRLCDLRTKQNHIHYRNGHFRPFHKLYRIFKDLSRTPLAFDSFMDFFGLSNRGKRTGTFFFRESSREKNRTPEYVKNFGVYATLGDAYRIRQRYYVVA